MTKIKYEDLLGKPFVEGGIGGYDCYTLSVEVCKRAGIFLPEKQTKLLSDSEHVEERSKAIISGSNQDYIRLDKPEKFCIVTFNLRADFVNHMGVMLDDWRFIHIMRKRSVAVEKIDHPYWITKIEGFYRYAN